MIFSDHNLPNDIGALKALVLSERGARQFAQSVAVSAETVASEERTIAVRERDRADRLEKIVRELKRALFGRRSERLSADQFELTFEDLEVALGAIEAEPPLDDRSGGRRRRKSQVERGSLPPHLPREVVVIEPESTACACGCEMKRIGDDRSERLDVIPAQYRVIVTVRPKYACRHCQEGVVQAPAPARLIEGGLPTETMLAQVLVSKYADHIPLYRQSQILARQGIELNRSTLANWVGRAGFELRPIFDWLAQELKGSTKLFMDETKAPVLDPGRGKVKNGYLWALARDDSPWNGSDPPGVVYFYAPGRSGQYAERFLDGFTGVLQVDGYTGYNRVAKPGRIGGALQLAYCWAHARRKLFDIAQGGNAPIAQEGLRRIAAFYQIEKEIRSQSAADRLAIRQEKTRPLVLVFEEWLRNSLARLSKGSNTADALRYIKNHLSGLKLFLNDGRLEMDNNSVERSIRPIALNRKNSLFAGHDEGGKNWGIIASLIETCKLNGVNPQTYLTDVMSRIADGHPQNRIHELMPWAYRQEKI